jgi:hypothetical protein
MEGASYCDGGVHLKMNVGAARVSAADAARDLRSTR